MIKIGKPFVYDDGKYAYLKANVFISEETSTAYIKASKIIKKVHWRTSDNYPPIEWQSEDSGLWFAVPVEYKDYLCYERGDSFVVAMLWYAMITGSDIIVGKDGVPYYKVSYSSIMYRRERIPQNQDSWSNNRPAT